MRFVNSASVANDSGKLIKTITYVLISLTFGIFASFAANAYTIGIVVGKNKTKTSTSNQEKMCVLRDVASAIESRHKDVDVLFVENERSIIGSVKAAQKLVDNKVDLALLPLLSHEAKVVAEILTASDIPFVTTATSRDVIAPNGHGLSTMPSNLEQVEVLAKYYFDNHPGKRIVIIADPARDYSENMAKMFLSTVKQHQPNTNVLNRTFRRSVLPQIANEISSDDVIFAPIYNPMIAELYLALAAKKDVNFNIIGPDSIGGRQEFYEVIEKTSDNISLRFIKNWDNTLKGVEKKTALDLVEEECPKGKPTFLTTYSYDLINLVYSQIDQIKNSSSPADTIQILRNSTYVSSMDGVLMQFSELGYNKKNLYLYEVAENGLELVQTLEHD